MGDTDEAFEATRREPDPIKRGRQATELLAIYQQRSTELARLRRSAIEEARDVLGESYTEVAKAFGITKARVTQIRSSAPPIERALFGVGPLVVALPGRTILDRQDVVIASEDDVTGAHLLEHLERLAFQTERYVIDPREEWEPEGDAVVVCGPASAHIGHKLMGEDVRIGMEIGDNVMWRVVDKDTGESFLSPLDDEPSERADHAYIARHVHDGNVIFHIAGLHALGSIGAAHYVIKNAEELFRTYGDREFSMAVTSRFEGQTPTSIDVLIPPKEWQS